MIDNEILGLFLLAFLQCIQRTQLIKAEPTLSSIKKIIKKLMFFKNVTYFVSHNKI